MLVREAEVVATTRTQHQIRTMNATIRFLLLVAGAALLKPAEAAPTVGDDPSVNSHRRLSHEVGESKSPPPPSPPSPPVPPTPPMGPPSPPPPVPPLDEEDAWAGLDYLPRYGAAMSSTYFSHGALNCINDLDEDVCQTGDEDSPANYTIDPCVTASRLITSWSEHSYTRPALPVRLRAHKIDASACA